VTLSWSDWSALVNKRCCRPAGVSSTAVRHGISDKVKRPALWREPDGSAIAGSTCGHPQRQLGDSEQTCSSPLMNGG
jgi:hypothetical protein